MMPARRNGSPGRQGTGRLHETTKSEPRLRGICVSMTSSPRNRQAYARRMRSSLCWAAATFALLQATFPLAVDYRLPTLRDPEFGHKLARLRARQREQPLRPLALIIGSSRSAMGLRPDVLETAAEGGGKTPLVFNFGMTGYGPVQELVLLKRLLRAGVRPQRVLIEVHPLLLHQENGHGEEIWLNVAGLDWGDVRTITPYLSDPEPLFEKWLHYRLVPWHSHRLALWEQFESFRTRRAAKQDAWTLMDPHGWLPYYQPSVTADEHQKGLTHARQEYDAALSGFRVSPSPDRALREMLETCRRESIDAALFLMPEGSGFRDFYPPGSRRQIDDYLAGLCRQYGCRCYDATSWRPDGDFWDGHHLLPRGAASFSRQFARATELTPLDDSGTRAGSLARRQRDETSVPSTLRIGARLRNRPADSK